MKILFIDTRSTSDWGLDLLWAGLVHNLGPENVIDFPNQGKHRADFKNIGLVGDPEKDWGLERGSLGYTIWNKDIPGYSRESINELLKKNEISVVFVDEKEESFKKLQEFPLIKLLKIPVVVVAGHDKFWNHSPEFVRKNYYPNNLLSMYLDNWRPEYDLLPYARNYNWAINFDHLWDPNDRTKYLSDKVYDICFMGYNSHPDRQYYIQHILDRWSHRLNNHIVLETRPNTFDCFVSKREYFKTIAQSKIVLNLRGAAENGKTMRFWEIPYVGSFMVSQPLHNQIDPFINNVHCQYFNSTTELDASISWALYDWRGREEIAKAGHEHAMKNHNVGHRVCEMLRQIREELPKYWRK